MTIQKISKKNELQRNLSGFKHEKNNLRKHDTSQWSPCLTIGWVMN